MSPAVSRQPLTTSVISKPAIVYARLVVDLTVRVVGQMFLRLLCIFPIMMIPKMFHIYLRFKISLASCTGK